MLRKFGMRMKLAKTDLYQDLNVLSKDLSGQFPNFLKRVSAIEPIRLYPQDYVYFRNRSVSAEESWGPNQNADAFPRSELQTRYATFINTPVVIDHVNEKVIGMVLDSQYIPMQRYFKDSGLFIPYNYEKVSGIDGESQIIGDWVENVLAVNKKLAGREYSNLIEMIMDGEVTDSSMGAFVEYSLCSISTCGNKASEENEFCDHVKKFKGKTITVSSSGRSPWKEQAYERNFGVTFFQDSIIIPNHLGGVAGGEGADPGAKLLEHLASKERNPLEKYLLNRVISADKKTVVALGLAEEPIGDKPDEVKEKEDEYQNSQEEKPDEAPNTATPPKTNELVEKLDKITQDLEETKEMLKNQIQDNVEEGVEQEKVPGDIDFLQGSKKTYSKKITVRLAKRITVRSDYTQPIDPNATQPVPTDDKQILQFIQQKLEQGIPFEQATQEAQQQFGILVSKSN